MGIQLRFLDKGKEGKILQVREVNIVEVNDGIPGGLTPEEEAAFVPNVHEEEVVLVDWADVPVVTAAAAATE